MLIENTPPLKTQRLTLRKFTENDDDALFKILSDREANTFLPWFPIETLCEAKTFLETNYISAYRKPAAYRYAICMKEDDMPIGYVNLGDGESLDLGYGLRMEFWHRGIVTEAAQAVAERLKAAGFGYITATHDINNPRSGAVMKKLGMTYRYSYVEQCQPKDISVTFRMYQLDFSVDCETYAGYWKRYPRHFIEPGLQPPLYRVE